MINIDRTKQLADVEYFPERMNKSMIVLHHTISGSFESVWNYWRSDRNANGTVRRVATAFVIDRDGTIHEVFPPEYWAHHIGSTLPTNGRANKRSIGIELVSEGALKLIDGKFYWMDGEIPYRSSSASVYTAPAPWRGYEFFDAYEEMQMQALEQLLPLLCDEFNIPRQLLPEADRIQYRPDCLSAFNGILSHCNLRADKTDLHPGFDWQRIERALK